VRPDGRPSGRVTAIEKQRRGERLNLFLDGVFALAVSADVAARAGLRVGGQIDGDELAALREEASRADAMASALRLLSYRPRSEAELRQRLARRGAPEATVEATLSRLRELGLADDDAFARSWLESRDRAAPRSRRLLQQELRAKGIGAEAAREASSSIDDEDAAWRAASRRLTALRGLPEDEFRRRLSDFLRRRGFGYETARATVERSRRELSEGADGA
jgi:regulatory protein